MSSVAAIVGGSSTNQLVPFSTSEGTAGDLADGMVAVSSASHSGVPAALLMSIGISNVKEVLRSNSVVDSRREFSKILQSNRIYELWMMMMMMTRQEKLPSDELPRNGVACEYFNSTNRQNRGS